MHILPMAQSFVSELRRVRELQGPILLPASHRGIWSPCQQESEERRTRVYYILQHTCRVVEGIPEYHDRDLYGVVKCVNPQGEIEKCYYYSIGFVLIPVLPGPGNVDQERSATKWI